jgi:PTH1 family peptidyl-tRNA hydrolase
MNLLNPKPEYIIAALGNFGEKYKNTRHNAGFIAADYLIYRFNMKINYKNVVKFKNLCYNLKQTA